MKAIAYNIRYPEKQHLVRVNAKKHDLTFISNELNHDTLVYCHGKEAVILSTVKSLDQSLLFELQDFGIKQIICRNEKPNDAVTELAHNSGILINFIHDSLSDEKRAQQIINLLSYECKS